MRLERRVTTVLLIYTALLAGCADAPAPGRTGNYPVLEVGLSDIELETAYPANIAGRQDIDIYPKINGFIERVCVREGEAVRKGQTLFIIEQVQHKAALQTAEANVAAAKAAVATARLVYDSKKELFANDVVSRFDLSTAENQLLTAEAQLAQAEAQEVDARNNLSYTLVTSPANGIVGTIPYREGTLVSASMPRPLTTVSDNSQVYIYFSMPESQLLGLLRRWGSTAAALQDMPDITLSLNDGSIYPAAGRIETISGVIDPSTGAVSMRAEFPNADGLLRSGGSGNVIIPSTFRDAVVIPQSATFEIQDKIYAYRVVDGIARQTLIGVAKVNNGSDYIVESGIAAGDVIVTEGVGMLRDGMEIGSGSGGLQAGTADGPAGNEGDAFADDNTTEDPDANGEAEVAHAFAADGTTAAPDANGEAEVAHAGTAAVNSPEAVHGGNRTAMPTVRPEYTTYQRAALTTCLRIPESTRASAAYTVPGGEPKAKG